MGKWAWNFLRYYLLLLFPVVLLGFFQNCGTGFESSQMLSSNSRSLSGNSAGTSQPQGQLGHPTPQFELGSQIYQKNCQSCHGEKGSSTIRGSSESHIRTSFVEIQQMIPFNFGESITDEGVVALKEYLALNLNTSAEKCSPSSNHSQTGMLTPSELNSILMDPYLFSLSPVQLSALNLPEASSGGGLTFGNDSALQQVRGVLKKYFEASYTIADLSAKAKYNSSLCQKGESADICAERILKGLAYRAFRRPVANDDMSALMTHYKSANSFEAGVRAVIRLILIDPKFILKPAIKDPDAYSLASRLSFGLLGSSPDPTLLGKAADGSLNDDKVLDGEVDRLLKDPRASYYEKEFAQQWLGLEGLRDSKVTSETDALKETELFFANLRTSGAPVSDVIGAKYSFLNHRLTQLYGLPEVNANQGYQRVELPPRSNRQGVLGHSSVLKVTSVATRTSPVLRGHWVRNKFLCLDVGPADNDIPPLNETNLSELSIREALAQHSNSATGCYSCHSKMDNYGWPLEYFNKEGAFRTKYEVGGFVVDGRAELSEIGGRSVEKPLEYFAELDSSLTVKACIVEKQIQFMVSRTLVEEEKCHSRNIAREVVIPSGTYAEMIKAIVKSPVFKGQ